MHVANFDDAMLASIGGLRGIQISLKEMITLSSLSSNQNPLYQRISYFCSSKVKELRKVLKVNLILLLHYQKNTNCVITAAITSCSYKTRQDNDQKTWVYEVAQLMRSLIKHYSTYTITPIDIENECVIKASNWNPLQVRHMFLPCGICWDTKLAAV